MPKVFKLQQLGNAIQQILNAVSGKAEQSELNAHTGDGDVHVSTTEKSRWNDTYTKNQVDDRIEQGGKVKTVSVNGGDAVQPDEHGNIDIEVPTDLKDLNDDSTHRTVTDEEKSAWSGKQPAGDYATRTELANGLGALADGLGTLAEGLAGKQGTINDLETIRSGAGKGATSLQGVKMEGDDDPLTPDGDGVVTIPQPEIPDSVTSVITNNELVFQTPNGQSVKGKVGITTGADGLLHLTLTDEDGNVYSSPIAGLRVDGNALQYSNDGENWVTVQTFGKLAIKYVQASDPASGDEGDLALVGSTNAYVLKVYVGGSWVSVCNFGTLDLTSDGIIMAGDNKTLTQKINEVDSLIAELKSRTESLIPISASATNLSGYWTTSKTIATQYQRYRKRFPVEPLKKYLVSDTGTGFGTGNNFQVFVVAFIDANGNCLDGLLPDTVGWSFTNYEVTTPANTAFIDLTYQSGKDGSVIQLIIIDDTVLDLEAKNKKLWKEVINATSKNTVGFWEANGTISNQWPRYRDDFPVNAGEVYALSCNETGFGTGSGFTAQVIAFLDSSKQFISGMTPDEVGYSYSNLKVVTPPNTAYISITHYKTTSVCSFACITYAVDYLLERIDYLQEQIDTGQTITKQGVADFVNKTLTGKKYSIIGDSISTYQGYLPSDAAGYDGATYAYHYPKGDVDNVSKTWWKKLEALSGLTLLKNCSWSGSFAVGDSTATNTALAGCSTRRIKDLAERDSNGDIVTAPDIVLIYIGLNDFDQKTLGDWSVDSLLPSEGNITDFRSAYALMLSKVMREYPSAEVYCLTLLECTMSAVDAGGSGQYPCHNGSVSLHTWNNAIREIASAMGATVLELHECGINYWNVASYTRDLAHPNAAGTTLMANKLYKELKAKSKFFLATMD